MDQPGSSVFLYTVLIPVFILLLAQVLAFYFSYHNHHLSVLKLCRPFNIANGVLFQHVLKNDKIICMVGSLCKGTSFYKDIKFYSAEAELHKTT